MGSLGEALARAIDGRARGLAAEGAAPPGRAIHRLAARGRRRAGVGLGAVAAVAAFAVWLPTTEPTTDFDPSPHPTPGQEATVSVPLDAEEWAAGIYASMLECGDDVPAPHVSERGFTLEVVTGDSTSINSTLRYQGEPYDDITIDEPRAYVTTGGTVVGYVWSYTAGRYPVMDLRGDAEIPGPSFIPGSLNSGYFQACTEIDDDPDTMLLPAGDYEIVLVQGARHTPEVLALIDLEAGGHTLPWAASGTWIPGSIDCDRAIRYDIEYDSGSIPITCEPLGLAGATVDAEAGTVVLPYTVRQGPEDLDITLVSEPVTWTVEQDITVGSLGYTFFSEPAADLTLECGAGAEFWAFTGLDATAAVERPDDFVADTGAPIAFDITQVSAIQKGTVRIDSPADAWIVADTSVGYRVVAQATATFDPRGAVVIDRSSDFARTDLLLSDYIECEGRSAADDLRFDTYYFIIVEAHSVITGDDGARDEGEYVVVTLGEER